MTLERGTEREQKNGAGGLYKLKALRQFCRLAVRSVETFSNHKRGIPCRLLSPPQSLFLSSFGGVCVLDGDASACSLFPEEHGRLHTLLCDLEKRNAQ